jgi:hypothetical protein
MPEAKAATSRDARLRAIAARNRWLQEEAAFLRLYEAERDRPRPPDPRHKDSSNRHSVLRLEVEPGARLGPRSPWG